jgi:lysyl-tRNA synthetase class 2
LLKARALAINEWASRRLRTAFPVIASLAIFTALLLALMNIAVALGGRFEPIADGFEHVRLAVWQGSAILPGALGIFMLVLAYELWLRKRAALIALCSFIVVQAVVDVLRGVSRLAGPFVILAGVVFMASMSEFPARPDTASLKRFKIVVPLAVVAFFGYGIAGLYLMRSRLGLGNIGVYALADRSIKIVVGESNLTFHGWAIFFRDSLVVLALVFIVYLAVQAFRPYREAATADPSMRRKARDIVGRYGSDSLAYFNLRADKNLFFHNDEMFIAYRPVGDVAVMSGDPVGPVELVPEAIASFRKYCLERGWRVGAIGANGDLEPLYQEAGLRSFSVGEESILDLENFTLEGREVRKLRQSVNKLDKDGVTVEFMFNASIPSHVRHELARISVDWRGGRDETGYSMGLGRLMSAEDPDCLLSVAYDRDMSPIGFIYWTPMYPHRGFSLDIHRTKLDAPAAVSEFIIARTAQFLHRDGYRYLSLHFLAFSEHYRDDREEPGSAFWRTIAETFSGVFPIVSVYQFDKKFFPGWKKRLLLHESLLDLVLVGISVIAAESALGVTRPSDRKK